MFDEKIITLQNLTVFKDKIDDQFAKKADLSFTFSEAFGITILIHNGHVATGQEIPSFVEDGIEYSINIKADSGYVVPTSEKDIVVTGAIYTYQPTSKTTGQLSVIPSGDVSIEITCEQGAPSSLVPFSVGQNIDGVVVDPDGTSFSDLNAYLTGIFEESGQDSVNLLDLSTPVGIGAQTDRGILTISVFGGISTPIVYASDALPEASITEAGWWTVFGSGKSAQKITSVTTYDFGTSYAISAASISQYFTNDVNGVIFGAHLIPNVLVPFQTGETISGIQVDPNTRPTGYEDEALYPTVVDAMNAYLDSLTLSPNGRQLVAYDNTSGNGIFLMDRMGEESEPFGFRILIDPSGTGLIYSGGAAADLGIPSAGWWYFDFQTEEMTEITELTTVPMVSSPTATITSIDSDFDAINSVCLGIVEAQPASGLTPFEVGQTVSGIKFDTTKSVQEVVSVLENLEYDQGSEGSAYLLSITTDYALMVQTQGGMYAIMVFPRNGSSESDLVPVFASTNIPDYAVEGWQNLDANGEIETIIGNVVEIGQGSVWNDGSIIGAVASVGE